VFGTIKVQHIWSNAVLTAKLRSNTGILQAFPEKFLRRCRDVTQLLPEGFLVRPIVDLFHGA
jgi:hypothetical protein